MKPAQRGIRVWPGKLMCGENIDRVIYIDIPLMEYRRAWDLQTRLVAARIDGTLNADVILSLEHPRVYTLGRRGGRENLTVSEDFLKEKGISVVQVERGGNITYHGPGQLVVYPILKLASHHLSVTGYVDALERIMVNTATAWGIQAKGDEKNRGVWLGSAKLGSIGITVRRGISFHGLALNVNLSLEPFHWINPCGLSGISMTSIADLVDRGVDAVDMVDARQRMRQEFCRELETEVVHLWLDDPALDDLALENLTSPESLLLQPGDETVSPGDITILKTILRSVYDECPNINTD